MAGSPDHVRRERHPSHNPRLMCPGGVAGGDRGGVEEGAVRKGARNHVLAVALSDQHCPAAHGSIDQLYCIVFHRWERAQQTVRERAEKIPSVGAAKTEVVLLNIPVVPAPMLVCCNACSLLHRINCCHINLNLCVSSILYRRSKQTRTSETANQSHSPPAVPAHRPLQDHHEMVRPDL